ncbi:MAG: inner membrane-spanning protein YciB [Pseudomonadota bacterium]
MQSETVKRRESVKRLGQILAGFGEYAPLGLFVAFYWLEGLKAATIALVIAAPAGVVLIWAVRGRIAWLPVASAVLVLIFGGLTLWLDDPRFIKIKPTIIHLLLSAVMMCSLLLKKPAARMILGNAITLPPSVWAMLTRHFGLFFLSMAGLNELVWRTMSTDAWVLFKFFGIIGLTALFSCTQIYQIRHWLEQPEKSDDKSDDKSDKDPHDGE